MNHVDFSLERIALDRVTELKRDAAASRIARELGGIPREAAGQRTYTSLVRWWIRATVLLIRYPADPGRTLSLLSCLESPVTALDARTRNGANGCGG